MKVKKAAIFNRIEAQFLRECKARNFEVSREFAHYAIHVLARDIRIGINWSRYNVCDIDRYLNTLLKMYADPLEPLMNNLKMKFFYKNCKKINWKYLQETNEADNRQMLEHFITKVLQYPENCNEKQLEELQENMVSYIIMAYNIGDVNNYVLRLNVHKCLEYVLGKDDLHVYVLKKKYGRRAYLERMGATVCGLLIYNFVDNNSDSCYMDNILEELFVTKQNVEDAFKRAIQESSDCAKKSMRQIKKIFMLDFDARVVRCQQPVEKIRIMNKYAALFSCYAYLISQMNEILDTTILRIRTYMQKLTCVSARLQKVLEYRITADSEYAFPHFAYFAKLWKTFKMYHLHLKELQNAKNEMDKFVNDNVKEAFFNIIETTATRRMAPTIMNFSSLQSLSSEKGCNLNFLLPQKDHFKNYCSVTMALTNGMLVHSNRHKKLCSDSSLLFGFHNMEYAKYAEHNFNDLSNALNRVLFTTASLIVIFDLEDTIVQQDYIANFICECQICDCDKRTDATQTEFVLKNDLSKANEINVTWNVWNFYKADIKLANIRKMQTHSTQTVCTYGRKLESLECNLTRVHVSG